MTQEIYKNAELYDIFSYQQDFKKEARFIVDAVKQFKKSKGKFLLNVGCGTGSHDRYLKKHFAVTGVDLNKDMLRVAKSKNPDVDYKLGNMKTFRLEKAFDVITALTGVMCYNYTYNDLRTSLKNLNDHLKEGGVLIYNVAVVKEVAFGKNRRCLAFTSTYSMKDMDIVLIDNPYDPNKKDTTFETHLVFLIRKNRGPLRIIVDKHLQGIFELKKVKRMLKEIGLDYKLYENDFSGEEYKNRGPIYVCIKRGTVWT